MRFSSYDTTPPTQMPNKPAHRATLLVPIFSCRGRMEEGTEVHVCSIDFSVAGGLYTVMDSSGATISGIAGAKMISVPLGMMEALMDGEFDDDEPGA